MNIKPIHTGWVAAAQVDELSSSGGSLDSPGAFFKTGVTKTDLSVSRDKKFPVLEKILPVIKSGPWTLEITVMEQFFQSVTLPEGPVRIDKGAQITNIKLFIKSHLGIVKGQNGNSRYLPYMDRLKALYLKLK